MYKIRASRNDERDVRRRLVCDHFIKLLVLHLHVPVVRAEHENSAVSQPVVFHSLDVRAYHIVVLRDHGVVPGNDILLVLCCVLVRHG